MPTLPGKTLGQAHYDRVVAAFPGTTPQQKLASYNAWLTNHLIAYVEQVEVQNVVNAMQTQTEKKAAEIAASLPPRLLFPPEFEETPPPETTSTASVKK